jgi:hypothetical protein
LEKAISPCLNIVLGFALLSSSLMKTKSSVPSSKYFKFEILKKGMPLVWYLSAFKSKIPFLINFEYTEIFLCL